jgi:hypothetical protein
MKPSTEISSMEEVEAAEAKMHAARSALLHYIEARTLVEHEKYRKGISAALLMASLRGSLRGQTIECTTDLAKVVRNVNQLLFESSTENRYATLVSVHVAFFE